jgi:hypothetical protein
MLDYSSSDDKNSEYYTTESPSDEDEDSEPSAVPGKDFDAALHANPNIRVKH